MEYSCAICNYFSNRKYDVEKHRKTKKHLKKVEENTKKSKTYKTAKTPNLEPNSAPKRLLKYEKTCQYCNRLFSKKANLNKHLLKIHGIDKRKFTLEKAKESNSAPENKEMSEDTSSENPHFSSENPQKKDYANLLKRVRCDYCFKKYSRMDNLKRHYTTCKEKKRIEEEDSDIRKQLIEKDRIIADLSRANSKQAGSIERMTATFQQICGSMKNAPVFELTQENRKAIIYQKNPDDDEFIKHIIYQYDHGNFDKYIGDGIIEIYKTENPEDQSIWSTDVTRLNYIIRRIMRKKLVWYNDKKGEIMKHILIEPLLEDIAKIVNGYLQSVKIPKTGPWRDEYDRQKSAMKFVVELIDDKVYADRICRYIAPHFKASKFTLAIEE